MAQSSDPALRAHRQTAAPQRWLIRLLFVVVTAEATSTVALLALHGPFRFSDFAALRLESIRQGEAVRADRPHGGRATTMAVPHPYLGFTNDPSFDPERVKSVHTVPVSEWGFLDDKSPIQAASPDRVVVGLFGGSFAFWNSVHGVEALREELGKAGAFAGKDFVFVRTAMGGYKQPQQLMTLAWLLALGAHFDIVINLDGFNEVALPATNIVPAGYFAFFPRDWPGMLGVTGGPDRARMIGALTYLQAMRSSRAEWFSKAPLRWSPTANLVWLLLDRQMAGRHDRYQIELSALAPTQLSYAARGPSRTYASADAMHEDLTEVWKRSSLEMARLCAGLGIPYFHFLQPNQYVAGSKPIGEEEARVAFQRGAPYEAGARGGYPKLVEKGRTLAAEGVDFEDLTQVFAATSEPRYVDSCCHVNPEGYAEVSRRIGSRVRGAIDRRAAASPRGSATGVDPSPRGAMILDATP